MRSRTLIQSQVDMLQNRTTYLDIVRGCRHVVVLSSTTLHTEEHTTHRSDYCHISNLRMKHQSYSPAPLKDAP